MKNTILALLIAILVVALVNLLVSFGILGGGANSSGAGGSYEYQVLSGEMMDNVGFRAIAEEEGIEVSEEGQINFPKELGPKLVKPNLLPRTIQEVEKDGGWEYVSVTSDFHYIFRRAK